MTVVEAIVAEVASAHIVEHRDLVGPRRRRELVDARAEAAARLFKETDLRLWQIGQALGGRHHSTVIAMLRRHAATTAEEDVPDNGAVEATTYRGRQP